MRKFLYLCLLGTALTGVVAEASMYDGATADSIKAPTGYNPASIGNSSTTTPSTVFHSNLGKYVTKESTAGQTIQKVNSGTSSLNNTEMQSLLGNNYDSDFASKGAGVGATVSYDGNIWKKTSDNTWVNTSKVDTSSKVKTDASKTEVKTDASKTEVKTDASKTEVKTDASKTEVKTDASKTEVASQKSVKITEENYESTSSTYDATTGTETFTGVKDGKTYTRTITADGKTETKIIDNKTGEWTGTDASGKKISGYTKSDGTLVQGERITKTTLSDGSVKRFDNATGNSLITKNGATTVLNDKGVSTNTWVSNKTGKTVSGLTEGSTLKGGSYTNSGEIYNSGTLGMGKTQVYKNTETGQYFTTSKIDSKTGQATVESAFQNSGTTAGEYNIQYDPKTGETLMVASDGKSFTNFTTEVVGTDGAYSVHFDTKTGKFIDQYDNVYSYDAKNKQFNLTEKASDSDMAPESGSVKANEKMDEAMQEADEAKAAATAAAQLPDKAVTQNAVEYGITIAEAVVGSEKADLTENTTVQGAEQVVEAQDSTHTSKIVSATKDDALSATTISSAANVMIALLNANTLDLTMLDDTACNTGTGSAGQGTTTGSATGGIDTTAYKKCIKNKRALFAQTVAVASQIIAEGSNAVSSKFYDRVNQLMTEANGQYTSEFADAHGSLGAISVVNDAERYPYFEMVRGAALSAVQLTAKGAENLVELDVEINTEEEEEE